MDLESELLTGWTDETTCEMCFAEGVVLHRQRFYGTTEDAFVCTNCLADLRALDPERDRP